MPGGSTATPPAHYRTLSPQRCKDGHPPLIARKRCTERDSGEELQWRYTLHLGSVQESDPLQLGTRFEQDTEPVPTVDGCGAASLCPVCSQEQQIKW